jgi:hypothetical protein
LPKEKRIKPLKRSHATAGEAGKGTLNEKQPPLQPSVATDAPLGTFISFQSFQEQISFFILW